MHIQYDILFYVENKNVNVIPNSERDGRQTAFLIACVVSIIKGMDSFMAVYDSCGV